LLSESDEPDQERREKREKDFKNMQQNINQGVSAADGDEFYKPKKYSGIGAEVDFEYCEGQWKITVVSVVENGPAFDADVKEGHIYSVQGSSDEQSLKDIINYIRGGGLQYLSVDLSTESRTSIFERNSEDKYELYKFEKERPSQELIL
jgi:C-terminal processing protease CtpA/Prc